MGCCMNLSKKDDKTHMIIENINDPQQWPGGGQKKNDAEKENNPKEVQLQNNGELQKDEVQLVLLKCKHNRKDLQIQIEKIIYEENVKDQSFFIDDQISQIGINYGGSVNELIHLQKKEIFAQKTCKNKKDFETELKQYRQLKGTIKDLDKYAMTVYRANLDRKVLIFKPAICTLKDYMNELIKNKQQISINNIVYMFKFSVRFILKLKESGYVHNNLKPENIMIDNIDDMEEIQKIEKYKDPQTLSRTKCLKVIGLKSCNDKLKCQDFTAMYMKIPKNTQNIGKQIALEGTTLPDFQNEDQRYQGELFCVFRSVNELMLKTAIENDKNFELVKNFMEQKKVQEKSQANKQFSQFQIGMQNLWKNASEADEFVGLNDLAFKIYSQENKKQSKDQTLFTDFIEMNDIMKDIIKQKMDIENKRLGNFVNTKVNYEDEESFFLDQNAVAEKLIFEKRANLRKKQSVLEEFKGIKKYVPLQASYAEDEKQQFDHQNFDVLETVYELLVKNIKNKININRVVFIKGEAGYGKSLLSVQLKLKLNEIENTKLILVKLGQSREEEPDPRQNFLLNQQQNQKLTDKIKKLYKQEDELDQNQLQNLIFILDGFDEYYNPERMDKQKFFGDIFQMSARKNVQIVVTSRNVCGDLLMNQDTTNELFCYKLDNSNEPQKPTIINIKPFNEDQKSKYIDKLIEYQHELRKYFIEKQQLDQDLMKKQFRQIIETNPSLKDMMNFPIAIKNAFMMITDMLSHQKQNKSITLLQIYEKFCWFWLKQEFLRYCEQDAGTKEDLTDFYGIEIIEDDQYKDNIIQDLIEDFKKVNIQICWLMFENGQKEITQKELDDYLKTLDQKKILFLESSSLITLFQNCSPLRINQSEKIEYFHSSIFDYYLIQGIYDDININLEEGQNYLYVNRELITEESQALQIIGQQINFDISQEKLLQKFVYNNRKNLSHIKKYQIAAANVMSIINASGYQFYEHKFIGCDLQKVNLMQSKILNCKFTDCNLEETDFSSSIIQYNEFQNCNLNKVVFENKKQAKQQYEIDDTHCCVVKYICFNFDASQFASAGGIDRKIRFFNVLEGIQFKTLECKGQGQITCLTYSFDGKYLGSCSSEDNSIQIYDLIAGKWYKSLAGHSGVVRSIKFSPKNDFLISGANDKKILYWDLQQDFKQTLVQNKSEHDDAVVNLCYSRNGDFFASGSSDNSIKVWNSKTFKPQQLNGHSAEVTCLRFSPDSKLLVSGSKDSTVRVWNLETYLEESCLKEHTECVTGISFSIDGKYIASGSWDKSINIWSLEKKAVEKKLTGHLDKINVVKFSPCGKYIASGSDDHSIRLWNISEGKQIKKLDNRNENEKNEPAGGVYSASQHPKNNYIVCGLGNKIVRVWDQEKNEKIDLIGHKGIVLATKFSVDGNQIASASCDKTIIIWDAVNPKQAKSLYVLEHEDYVNSLEFSKNGKYLASGSDDKTIVLWNVKEQYKKERILKDHTKYVNAICFCPEDRFLVSGSDDCSLILWEVENGKNVKTFQQHEGPVRCVQFSPKGNYIVSGSSDNNIIVWGYDGQVKWQFKKHTDYVKKLSFSANGEFLASASFDETIIVWHFQENGKPIMQLKGHNAYVNFVKFSKEGNQLITAGLDDTIRFWDVDMSIKNIKLQKVITNKHQLSLSNSTFDVSKQSIDKNIQECIEKHEGKIINQQQ